MCRLRILSLDEAIVVDEIPVPGPPWRGLQPSFGPIGHRYEHRSVILVKVNEGSWDTILKLCPPWNFNAVPVRITLVSGASGQQIS